MLILNSILDFALRKIKFFSRNFFCRLFKYHHVCESTGAISRSMYPFVAHFVLFTRVLAHLQLKLTLKSSSRFLKNALSEFSENLHRNTFGGIFSVCKTSEKFIMGFFQKEGFNMDTKYVIS